MPRCQHQFVLSMQIIKRSSLLAAPTTQHAVRAIGNGSSGSGEGGGVGSLLMPPPFPPFPPSPPSLPPLPSTPPYMPPNLISDSEMSMRETGVRLAEAGIALFALLVLAITLLRDFISMLRGKLKPQKESQVCYDNSLASLHLPHISTHLHLSHLHTPPTLPSSLTSPFSALLAHTLFLDAYRLALWNAPRHRLQGLVANLPDDECLRHRIVMRRRDLFQGQ